MHTADKLRSICMRMRKRLPMSAAQRHICKFDLVTQMVYEFPELQGIMGEDYARKAGEREAVARAINEHYQPRFAGDRAPASISRCYRQHCGQNRYDRRLLLDRHHTDWFAGSLCACAVKQQVSCRSCWLMA